MTAPLTKGAKKLRGTGPLGCFSRHFSTLSAVPSFPLLPMIAFDLVQKIRGRFR